MKRRIGCRGVAALVAYCVAAPGWAQVDEIVVTARKKVENLQDVPLSVTALDQELIERRGVRNITDVAKYTPSVQFDESFAQSDTRITIRGLAPTRGRQNVAVLVDGIDLSSEAITSSGGSLLINTRLLDLERVEIVKGPQLALYGRSAFAGAIQYVTRKPSDEFEAQINLDANAEDQFNLNAGVSFPVIEDLLAVRLNASAWDEQGFYDNDLTGDSLADRQGLGFALSTRSEFGNGLSINFRAEYTADEGRPSAQTLVPFNVALDAPAASFGGAGGADITQCRTDIIGAVGSVANPDAARNNRLLVERARRTLDPALAAELGFPDPATATAADYAAAVAANPFLSPYCEARSLSYTGALPDGDQVTLRQATNPLTPGEDYEGYDRDFWRLALNAEWAFEKGTLTAWAGYLRDDNTETQDTNTFGIPANNIYGDANVNSFSFNNEKLTEQTNFEIRYQSTLDGPFNLALGALSWKEDVENFSSSVTGQASGSHCFWSSASGFPVVGPPTFCPGYTETPIAPYQAAIAGFRPASPVNRFTDHWSVYSQLTFDLSETWTLSFEGRYNYEKVTVEGPIPYDPGASGGPGGFNPCGIFFRPCADFDTWVAGGNWFADSFDVADDPGLIDTIPDACWQQEPDEVQRSIDFGPTADLDGDGQFDNIDAFNPWCVGQLSQTSNWFVPKLILDWKVADDVLVYFSWADAQKPGGFSLLTVGSSFLEREITEFRPEKMEVWEIGANSEWFDRTLRVNGSFFFQDFTDKQALTSALGNDGRLVAKIENAGAAEVWGAEVEVTWAPARPFLGGDWVFNLGYQWLDTEYTDFRVNSGSPVSAANAGNCTPVTVQTADGPESLCELSYSGNQLEDAPPNNVVYSMRYGKLFGDREFFIEADAQWTDDRYTDITNTAYVKAFWNADLRVGLQADNWEVLAYVTNLFDDDTVRSAGGGPGLGCCFVLGSAIDNGQVPPAVDVLVDLPLGVTAFLPPPRIVGLRASYRFGGPR